MNPRQPLPTDPAEHGPWKPPATPARQKDQQAAHWDPGDSRHSLPSASFLAERRHEIKGFGWGGEKKPCRKVWCHYVKGFVIIYADCPLGSPTHRWFSVWAGGEGEALREASEPGNQYLNCLGTSQTILGRRTLIYTRIFRILPSGSPSSYRWGHRCHALCGE